MGVVNQLHLVGTPAWIGKNLACQPNSRHDNFVLLSFKKKLVLVVAQVATRGCSGRRPPGGKNPQLSILPGPGKE